MFVWIAFLLLGAIVLLALWHWLQGSLFFQKNLSKTLRQIEKQLILGRWKEAEKELLPLLKIEKKEISLFYIKVLRGTKKWDLALTTVGKALLHYLEEPLFYVEKAKIHLALGQHKEAFFAFQKGNLREEIDIVDYAETALLCGQTDVAKKTLEPILEGKLAHQCSSKLCLLAGDVFYEKCSFSEAIHWYSLSEQQGEEGVSMAETSTKLGHAYRRFGNLAEAEKIFRKVLEKDSGNLSATLGLGLCMQERGNHRKALLFFQAGDAWAKKEPLLLFQAGISALYLQKYNYASAYFKEIIAKEGKSPKMLLYYGYSLEGQQLWDKAEQIYLDLLQQFPNYEGGYLALGWLFGVGLCRTLTEEEGIQYAYRALKLNPQPHTYEIVSACEARVGNFEKAHKIQEYLATIDPQSRIRRLEVMRHLRKKLPLANFQVQKAIQKELVA